jgi:hypothetical protein
VYGKEHQLQGSPSLVLIASQCILCISYRRAIIRYDMLTVVDVGCAGIGRTMQDTLLFARVRVLWRLLAYKCANCDAMLVLIGGTRHTI